MGPELGRAALGRCEAAADAAARPAAGAGDRRDHAAVERVVVQRAAADGADAGGCEFDAGVEGDTVFGLAQAGRVGGGGV